MNQQPFWQRPFTWIFGVFIIFFIIAMIFTMHNERFYNIPIGQIVSEHTSHGESVEDDHHNKDIKYKQHFTIKILNGSHRDKTVDINHNYMKAQVDSERFEKGDKVLLHTDDAAKSVYIIEKKRDTLVVFMTGLFLLTIIWVGKRVGLQSILSLILNTVAIIAAIALHSTNPHLNLFALMVAAVIVSTVITLLLVTGWTLRTLVTITSTLLGTFVSIGLMQLIIRFTNGEGLKFETLGFLTMPPKEVFLASVMIGSLGAVMDVAITIASGMYEILRRNPDISATRWALAGRNIGQDIMGTMTNILLFSYLSGSLPMFLIYLKNANTITYSISMNWSLEISRAITGGIGIVLTIPITILLMEVWLKMRGVKR